MKMLKLHFSVLFVVAALFYAPIAIGQIVTTINASNSPYDSRPAIQGVTVQSDTFVRTGALSQAAGVYRSQTGGLSSPLKVGATFKMIYEDGSSELGVIVSLSSDTDAAPVPGTQQAAPASGGGGGGGDPNGGGGGGGSGGGFIGGSGCYGDCDPEGIVEIGEIKPN